MQELTPWSLGSSGRGILWNDGELQLWATPSRFEGPYHHDVESTQPDRLADARLVVDEKGGTELFGSGLDDVGERWPAIVAQQPDLRLTRVDEHWTANPEGDWNLEAMDADDLFDGGRVGVVSPEKLPEQSPILGASSAVSLGWGLSTTPIADDGPVGVSLRHKRRVAGNKLKWLLERPDKRLQTPEGAAFLSELSKHVERDNKIDALAPWLAREWKKGRLHHSPGAHIPFYYDAQPPDHPEAYRDHGDAGTLSHWADWFNSNHPTRRGVDIMQMKTYDMEAKIREWEEHMKAEAEARADTENEEQRNGGKVLHTFDDGWTVRDLAPEHLTWEGDRMASDDGYPICVGSHGYPEAVGRGDVKILSLRDDKGYPHVTAEIEPWHENQNPEGDRFGPWHRHTDIKRGNIKQIQGKGNSIPSPEYQARMKEFFETIPEADRPTWEGEPVDHPKELYQHEYNDPRHPNRYMDDQGGYTPHGDYGVKITQPVDYDELLDPEADKILDPYGPAWASSQFNGEAVENIDAVYRHALENNRIPEFAKAVQTWGDWAGEDLRDHADQNIDNFTVPYPGESQEEAEEMGHSYPEFGDPAYDPNWFDSWQDHQEAYDNERNDMEDSHEPSKAANYMYKLINPHYDPVQNEYANGWYSHPMDQMRSHPGLKDFEDKMGVQPTTWKRTADTLNQMGDQPVDFCPWCQKQEAHWIQLVPGDAAHLKCPNCLRQYHPDDVRLHAPDFGYRGPQTNPRWNSHTNEALGGNESDGWVIPESVLASDFVTGTTNSEALTVRPVVHVPTSAISTGSEGSLSSLGIRPLHSDPHDSLGWTQEDGSTVGLHGREIEGSWLISESTKGTDTVMNKAGATDAEMKDRTGHGIVNGIVANDTIPGGVNESVNAHGDSLSSASSSRQAQSNLPEPAPFVPPQPQVIEIAHEGYSVDHPEGGQYFPSEEEMTNNAAEGHAVRRPFFVAQDKVYLGEADSYHDDLAEHARSQGHEIPEYASRGGYGWSDDPHSVNWFDQRLKPEWRRAAEQALHAHHGYEEPSWMLSNVENASALQTDWTAATTASSVGDHWVFANVGPMESGDVTATTQRASGNDVDSVPTLLESVNGPLQVSQGPLVVCDRCWKQYESSLPKCPRCGTPRRYAKALINQPDGRSIMAAVADIGVSQDLSASPMLGGVDPSSDPASLAGMTFSDSLADFVFDAEKERGRVGLSDGMGGGHSSLPHSGSLDDEPQSDPQHYEGNDNGDDWKSMHVANDSTELTYPGQEPRQEGKAWKGIRTADGQLLTWRSYQPHEKEHGIDLHHNTAFGLMEEEFDDARAFYGNWDGLRDRLPHEIRPETWKLTNADEWSRAQDDGWLAPPASRAMAQDASGLDNISVDADVALMDSADPGVSAPDAAMEIGWSSSPHSAHQAFVNQSNGWIAASADDHYDRWARDRQPSFDEAAPALKALTDADLRLSSNGRHGQRIAAAMPTHGVVPGEPGQPLYRYMTVPHDFDVNSLLGQQRAHQTGTHWTHDYNTARSLVNDWWDDPEEHKAIILHATHPGHEHIMDWDNPRDLDFMERTIVGREYADHAYPSEVPVRPNAPLNVHNVDVFDGSQDENLDYTNERLGAMTPIQLHPTIDNEWNDWKGLKLVDGTEHFWPTVDRHRQPHHYDVAAQLGLIDDDSVIDDDQILDYYDKDYGHPSWYEAPSDGFNFASVASATKSLRVDDAQWEFSSQMNGGQATSADIFRESGVHPQGRGDVSDASPAAIAAQDDRNVVSEFSIESGHSLEVDDASGWDELDGNRPIARQTPDHISFGIEHSEGSAKRTVGDRARHSLAPLPPTTSAVEDNAQQENEWSVESLEDGRASEVSHSVESSSYMPASPPIPTTTLSAPQQTAQPSRVYEAKTPWTKRLWAKLKAIAGYTTDPHYHWTPDQPIDEPWTQGNKGKGLIYPDSVRTWNVDRYESPHHGDVDLGVRHTAIAFEIRPDGTVDSWRTGGLEDYLPLLQAHNPALHLPTQWTQPLASSTQLPLPQNPEDIEHYARLNGSRYPASENADLNSKLASDEDEWSEEWAPTHAEGLYHVTAPENRERIKQWGLQPGIPQKEHGSQYDLPGQPEGVYLHTSPDQAISWEWMEGRDKIWGPSNHGDIWEVDPDYVNDWEFGDYYFPNVPIVKHPIPPEALTLRTDLGRYWPTSKLASEDSPYARLYHGSPIPITGDMRQVFLTTDPSEARDYAGIGIGSHGHVYEFGHSFDAPFDPSSDDRVSKAGLNPTAQRMLWRDLADEGYDHVVRQHPSGHHTVVALDSSKLNPTNHWKIDKDDWDWMPHTSSADKWEPGQEGRALLYPSGVVDSWTTQGMDGPYHIDYYPTMTREGDPRHGDPKHLWLDSDGYVDGINLSEQERALLKAHHPDLYTYHDEDFKLTNRGPTLDRTAAEVTLPGQNPRVKGTPWKGIRGTDGHLYTWADDHDEAPDHDDAERIVDATGAGYWGGYSYSKDYLPEEIKRGNDFKLAAELPSWKPGQYGKGWLESDGTVQTWNLDTGIYPGEKPSMQADGWYTGPHHYDVWDDASTGGGDVPFNIHPDGKVEVPGWAFTMAEEEETEDPTVDEGWLQAHHPDLHLEKNDFKLGATPEIIQLPQGRGDWGMGGPDDPGQRIPVLHDTQANKLYVGTPGDHHYELHKALGTDRADTRYMDAYVYPKRQQIGYFGRDPHPEGLAALHEHFGIPVPNRSEFHLANNWDWGLSEPHVTRHEPPGMKHDNTQRVPFVWWANPEDENDIHLFMGYPGTYHEDIHERPPVGAPDHFPAMYPKGTFIDPNDSNHYISPQGAGSIMGGPVEWSNRKPRERGNLEFYRGWWGTNFRGDPEYDDPSEENYPSHPHDRIRDMSQEAVAKHLTNDPEYAQAYGLDPWSQFKLGANENPQVSDDAQRWKEFEKAIPKGIRVNWAPWKGGEPSQEERDQGLVAYHDDSYPVLATDKDIHIGPFGSYHSDVEWPQELKGHMTSPLNEPYGRWYPGQGWWWFKDEHKPSWVKNDFKLGSDQTIEPLKLVKSPTHSLGERYTPVLWHYPSNTLYVGDDTIMRNHEGLAREMGLPRDPFGYSAAKDCEHGVIRPDHGDIHWYSRSPNDVIKDQMHAELGLPGFEQRFKLGADPTVHYHGEGPHAPIIYLEDENEIHVGEPGWSFFTTSSVESPGDDWEPGTYGKGIVLNNGTIDAWQINEYGAPHHIDQYDIVNDGHTLFQVDPDGHVDNLDIHPEKEGWSREQIQDALRITPQWKLAAREPCAACGKLFDTPGTCPSCGFYDEGDDDIPYTAPQSLEWPGKDPEFVQIDSDMGIPNRWHNNRLPMIYKHDQHKVYVGSPGTHHSELAAAAEFPATAQWAEGQTQGYHVPSTGETKWWYPPFPQLDWATSRYFKKPRDEFKLADVKHVEGETPLTDEMYRPPPVLRYPLIHDEDTKTTYVGEQGQHHYHMMEQMGYDPTVRASGEFPESWTLGVAPIHNPSPQWFGGSHWSPEYAAQVNSELRKTMGWPEPHQWNLEGSEELTGPPTLPKNK